jgi:transmembrane sensor
VSVRERSVTSAGSAPDQAAAWFARQRSGPSSEQDAEEFATWLKAHPSHTAAWASYERLWGRLDAVRDDPKILAIREQACRRTSRGQWARRIRWVGGALAASALLAICAWQAAPLLRVPMHAQQTAEKEPSNREAQELIRDASTEIGGRSILLLADGSKVTLNTASAVHADLSGRERRVTLIRGEAFFNVAKDASRPFMVSAGKHQVIAVGTAFDVRLQDAQVKVTLVEGKVRVVRTADLSSLPTITGQPSPQTAVMLEAGTTLVTRDDGANRIERLDTERATSWRSGKLVFDGERLADVVAEMNRYSREQLEIADPALKERKVSGVFEPTGGAGFAKALEAYGIARTARQTPTAIVLESPPSSTH